jgi:hypothetical protein
VQPDLVCAQALLAEHRSKGPQDVEIWAWDYSVRG